ncbi:MAG TPA: PTS glucitol/sorbitol transporter subunit IIC [Actinomycetales bacterium]|nr:PTS glucitol/sorbitol transporter subunit IIC [Actinomycetales bacterium]
MPFVTAVHVLGSVATPDVQPPTGVMGALAKAAQAFISTFQEGATFFTGLLVGIVPLLIVLLTAVNALVRLIGQERVEKLGIAASRPGIIWYPVRYLVLPFVAVFLFTNPMAYTVGMFLPERFKPAFYDSAVSFVHPITGLFPHANSGELFVYLGVAAGISKLGLPLGDLAVRYLLVGLVVILIRGIVTEFITKALMARRTRSDEAEAVAA